MSTQPITRQPLRHTDTATLLDAITTADAIAETVEQAYFRREASAEAWQAARDHYYAISDELTARNITH